MEGFNDAESHRRRSRTSCSFAFSCCSIRLRCSSISSESCLLSTLAFSNCRRKASDDVPEEDPYAHNRWRPSIPAARESERPGNSDGTAIYTYDTPMTFVRPMSPRTHFLTFGRHVEGVLARARAANLLFRSPGELFQNFHVFGRHVKGRAGTYPSSKLPFEVWVSCSKNFTSFAGT